MRNSTQFCPVPSEQQPINEYEQLKDSWIFQWVTFESGKYWRKLAWVWAGGWLVAGPIAAASFPPQKEPVLFGLGSAVGASILVVLVVLRLYLGWSYVCDRLKGATVVYEESGWYDGQTWPKPVEVLTRDRLVALYQVEPILARLKRTTLILAVFIGSSSLIWLCP